jgi:hypothetical protein
MTILFSRLTRDGSHHGPAVWFFEEVWYAGEDRVQMYRMIAGGATISLIQATMMISAVLIGFRITGLTHLLQLWLSCCSYRSSSSTRADHSSVLKDFHGST